LKAKKFDIIIPKNLDTSLCDNDLMRDFIYYSFLRNNHRKLGHIKFYKKKLKSISEELSCTQKTLNFRIHRLIQLDWAWVHGEHLYFRSLEKICIQLGAWVLPTAEEIEEKIKNGEKIKKFKSKKFKIRGVHTIQEGIDSIKLNIVKKNLITQGKRLRSNLQNSATAIKKTFEYSKSSEEFKRGMIQLESGAYLGVWSMNFDVSLSRESISKMLGFKTASGAQQFMDRMEKLGWIEEKSRAGVITRNSDLDKNQAMRAYKNAFGDNLPSSVFANDSAVLKMLPNQISFLRFEDSDYANNLIGIFKSDDSVKDKTKVELDRHFNCLLARQGFFRILKGLGYSESSISDFLLSYNPKFQKDYKIKDFLKSGYKHQGVSTINSVNYNNINNIIV